MGTTMKSSMQVLNEPQKYVDILSKWILQSLWGNVFDLSLFVVNEAIPDLISQAQEKGANEDFIIVNDLPKVLQYLILLKQSRIDFVLDNSGMFLSCF
jgi:hypothetical protein